MTFEEAYRALHQFQVAHPRNPVRVEMPYSDWCYLRAKAQKGELVTGPTGGDTLFGYPVKIVNDKPLRFVSDDDHPQKS
jgi:hypothetical protein